MIVTYEIAEADRAAFERAAGAHAAASDTYPGCLRFSVGHDINHPGRYQLIELWHDEHLLNEHGRSEAFQRTMTALKQCRILQMQPDRYKIP
ncbi:putative quinol monooxygenase [Kineococcus sp. GCM10028916]|uniref:putative quinol monooxygenase n=1 Tax=Kineococcus sp. GCM10028916 TaxID=3273394 RepID=UPI003642BA5A